jgi:enediyne biosynthesis protein E4
LKARLKNVSWLLAGLLLLSAAIFCLWVSRRPLPWEIPEHLNSPPQRNSLEVREEQADRTIWAKEKMAEACGHTFETFWDSINASTNKLAVAGAFSAGEVLLPKWGATQDLSHGIQLIRSIDVERVLGSAQWGPWLNRFSQAGWVLDNVEFRHNQFETDSQDLPYRSHIYFNARLSNHNQLQRVILEGDLVVSWETNSPIQALPKVKRIDASHLTLKSRIGEPFFTKTLQETITPADKTGLIDPLILSDLDGDGFSEIILAASNLVYRRTGTNQYKPQALCKYPVPFISTALLADFDGDGFPDFLCANGRGLFLFKGSSSGKFDEPPKLVWEAKPPLKNAMVLTCGDILHSGRLDVFLGQYKVPSLGQIIRPHYYDANDGFPSYLLRNDGRGNFTDVTGSSGLAAKRWRRTYSASFADLDGDGYLDLMVVSDFAGLDLYQNDGSGHFTEVTRDWIPESHAFGMASAIADFNVDGRPDLLMIGMPSPTVSRLEKLGLWRPYSDADPVFRSAMTYGNRLYLSKPGGGFEQTSLNDSIANSGWSWGCAAVDFDNDGFPDVYIANGLETKKTVQDYESEFWLHDIFIDDSADETSASRYFLHKFDQTRGSGWSYGGYEKNRLFLNQGGASFVEVGHLGGISIEEDSRNVVADDLDGDGRMDLVVTTFEVWPEVKQTLRIYRNELPDAGHWIGFRFPHNTKSAVGARITIYYAGRSATCEIITGASHRSESAAMAHFGLGRVGQIDSAEVHWADGTGTHFSELKADRYYPVNGAPNVP